MKLLSVVGARPNFMKIAPLAAAVTAHNTAYPADFIHHVLVHSGQHYDPTLSGRFFEELGIPAPDHHLEVGSGTHAFQVGKTMIEFERVLLEENPDWVIVVGDVNATCACALTAKKHQFRVAHIEAGLRSQDWTMPEEINRVVTDRLSDLLFTTCRFAGANLALEGVPASQIAFVGNIMIDTLERMLERTYSLDINDIVSANQFPNASSVWTGKLMDNAFGVLTLHRPSNVDDAETLARNLELFFDVAEMVPIVFPVHPRTVAKLEEYGLWQRLALCERIALVQPLGYLDLLKLTSTARFVLTDSGGLQEECCVVGTPCLTFRDNTERPATLAKNGGTNYLVGTDRSSVMELFQLILKQSRKPFRPPLWDGFTANRILDVLIQRTPAR